MVSAPAAEAAEAGAAAGAGTSAAAAVVLTVPPSRSPKAATIAPPASPAMSAMAANGTRRRARLAGRKAAGGRRAGSRASHGDAPVCGSVPGSVVLDMCGAPGLGLGHQPEGRAGAGADPSAARGQERMIRVSFDRRIRLELAVVPT